MRDPNARRELPPYRCSFCGKDDDSVVRLIAGPGDIYICNECVELCAQILLEEGYEFRAYPWRERPVRPPPEPERPVTPADRTRAERLVREAYEDIVRLSALGLERINRHRHPREQYCSIEEYAREQWARANAVSSFAVSMELITGEQAGWIISDFLYRHPDAPGGGPKRKT